MFYVRYSRCVAFADFLGGWFGRFSSCILVFSRCFRMIFLVDIFLADFLEGRFWLIFLADFDMFAKFVGVFGGFLGIGCGGLLNWIIFNWMAFMNRLRG